MWSGEPVMNPVSRGQGGSQKSTISQSRQDSTKPSTSNSPLDLGLDYSVANFLVPQILAHEDAETQLFVVNDELAHHPVKK